MTDKATDKRQHNTREPPEAVEEILSEAVEEILSEQTLLDQAESMLGSLNRKISRARKVPLQIRDNELLAQLRRAHMELRGLRELLEKRLRVYGG